MSGNIRLYGTSGYVELQAPSDANSQILVLPTDSIQPGLVHLHTEIFSSVSSISINNVFSSEYENYNVIYSVNGTSGGDLRARLRSSSIDETSANYDYQYLRAINTSVNTSRTSSSTYGVFGNTRSGVYNNGIVDMFQPFVSDRTSWVVNHQDWEPAIQIFRNGFSGNGSYDGFTMYPSSGTITGNVSVYGYRNS